MNLFFFFLQLLLLLNWYRLPTLDLLTLIKTLRPHGTHTLAHHRNKNPFCTFCLFTCVGVWLFSLVRRLQVSSGIGSGSVTHIVLLYIRFKFVTESATFALVCIILLSFANPMKIERTNDPVKKRTQSRFVVNITQMKYCLAIWLAALRLYHTINFFPSPSLSHTYKIYKKNSQFDDTG